MSTEPTFPFDPAEYLTDPEAQAELIDDALASGDAGYIANAIGTVARARGISVVARDSGRSRASLYKALSPSGDPRLTTLLGVLKSLGMQLSVRTTEHTSN
jgi:probable addiction module antidote protein